MASSLQINKLHPTFGAEIEGVDFSKPISDEQLTEIKDTIAQVRHHTSSKRECYLGSFKLSNLL